ncbi:IclR family transcriptional regulator [Halobacillus sp. Marseille-P3879]|uniref:IclR family transcriptional regulator n=1 Tax=Halobacillus sp. Marseille-P3879 TaxID=2045014 RepID=UPI001356B4A8|nr:IclR family transcriptional regulator [Halobacillus sp. Marseille-P3879]
MSHRSNTSLENALDVLKSFSGNNPELGVSELSKKLDIGVSTAHRLLSSLAEENFIVKNRETQKYSLGLSILELTNTVTDQLHIIRESIPILQRLRDDTGESAHLSIIDDSHVIYLQKVESPYNTQLDTFLGKRNPVHCTGAGQTILAYQSEGEMNRVLGTKMKAYTDYTITDVNKLKAKFAQIRKAGYAINNQEYQTDYFSISSPVSNKENLVIASISIVGPVQRMKPSKDTLINKVITAGLDLSQIIKRRQATAMRRG